MTTWEPFAANAYLPFLERASARFADVVATGDLSAPVTACPGWDLGDLGRHLGNVQRWALFALRENAPGPDVEDGPAAAAALSAWLREGTAQLFAQLRVTDPASERWNFGPRPRTAGFWFRRQAHEATIHLWDAEHAAGSPSTIDARFAADGLDEAVRIFFPRQVHLSRCPSLPASLSLAPTDVDNRWTLAGDGKSDAIHAADAVVRGPAEALLLLLWKRIAVDDPRLTLDGDPSAARTVLAAPIVP